MNMNLPYFTNAVSSGALQLPNQMYRDLEQEFINLQWENTTAIVEVQEQDDIGINHYHCIEVWVTPTMQETTRGLADVNDFNKFIFKDINHQVKRGQMYIFNDNYWIVHSYNAYNGVVQDCGVRRCNNILKIVDPLNGAIKSFPCCIDYDMASPSQQTNRYINTPNNHATVIVQGNDETLRLFKTNTRYLISGRPFKLLGYQNAVEYSLNLQQTTLLYLDLYLDELHDKDDIELGIADNGVYDYSISIATELSTLTVPLNIVGQLTADVKLNGIEVERPIHWLSSNKDVITINENGEYQVVGEIGETVWIKAGLDGNDEIEDTIEITIADLPQTQYSIQLDPAFDKIREYEKINFNIQLFNSRETIANFEVLEVSLDDVSKEYLSLIKIDEANYSITAFKYPNTLFVATLNIQVKILETDEIIAKSFYFSITNMFG